MKLLKELNEARGGHELPLAADVLDEFYDILVTAHAQFSKHETDDTSTPSAPDSSKFRASQSGKLEIAKNLTLHSYGGLRKQLALGMKVGSAIGHKNVKKVLDYIKSEWQEMADDYSDGDITIKTRDDKKVTLYDNDGTNYSTIGVNIT